jgi:hypothetical protein
MNQHVRSRSGLLILAITLLVSWPLLSANTSIQDKWVKLGERTVNHTVDHSEIVFESLNANVGALRVKVRKGAINLHRCVVYYQDNQTHEIDILNSIPAGQESKVIELPVPPKTINKLVFTYDTKNRATQKAEVEVMGRQ